jgi:hypothetical protein
MILNCNISNRNNNAARVGLRFLSIDFLEAIYAAMYAEMIDSLTMTLHTFFHDRLIQEVEEVKIKEREIQGIHDYESSNKSMEDAAIFMNQYYQGAESCSQIEPCLTCGRCKKLSALYSFRYDKFKRTLRVEHQNCLVIFF